MDESRLHLDTLISNITGIRDNVQYVRTELPEIVVPDATKDVIRMSLASIERCLLQIDVMLTTLRTTAMLPSRHEAAIQTARAIGEALTGEIPQLDRLVRRLMSLANEDASTFGLVSVLVGESAANILNLMTSSFRTLDLVVDELQKGRIAQISDSELWTRAHALLDATDVEEFRELLTSYPRLIGLRSGGSDLTLLHEAAGAGRFFAVTTLIDMGFDVADRSGQWIEDEVPEGGYFDPGDTAMMLAARGGHFDIVKLLTERGASVGDANHWGGTALLFACVANDLQIVNFLLANGANPDEICCVRHFDEELGWHQIGTPLHAAANCGGPEVARSLLGHGASVDPQLFVCRRTPLFYAAARGHHQTVKVLLNAGADPNRRETRPGYGFEIDFAPLHYAARNGHPETVRLLLEAGANPNAAVSHSGQIPIQLAREGDHHAVAELLATA